MSSRNVDVEILEFTAELAPHFKSINEAWITEMFTLEQADRDLLNDPQGTIIDHGGRILFAHQSKLGVVGTCALAKKHDRVYELTKMGVLDSARGLGIGELLLREALALAATMQIDNLFLLTNHRCKAAIHLYRKYRFRDDDEIMRRYGPAYDRCDVAMRYRE